MITGKGSIVATNCNKDVEAHNSWWAWPGQWEAEKGREGMQTEELKSPWPQVHCLSRTLEESMSQQ